MYLQIFLILILILFVIFSSVKLKKTRQEIVRKPSPILGSEALFSYAAALSKRDEIVPGRHGISSLLSRMQENYRYIASVYRKLNKSIRMKKRVSDNAEWLFDNFYIIEQQTRQILLSFKKKSDSRLPIIKSGAYRGYPRIFALAHEMVSHTDSVVDQKTLIGFMNAYQTNTHLRDDEIWSLKTILRIALIENIRRICEEIIETREQYDAAAELAEELWEVRDHRGKAETILKERLRFFEAEDSAYLEEIVSLLRRRGPESRLILSALEDRLGKLGMNLEDITRLEHQKQARRHISLGNAITSLRTLLNMDFTHVFEQLSAVEHILLNDPLGIYPLMDKASKNHYRMLVGKLAKKWNISEIEAAKQAVQLAAEYEGLDDRKRHVGYYLKYQSLQYDKRPSFEMKKTYYVSFLLIGPLLAGSIFGNYIYYLTDSIGMSVCLGCLSVLPLGAALQNIVNYCISKAVKPDLIPKLELADGIPDHAKTLAVISSLLTCEADADELTEKLLVYKKANMDRNLYFGILSDFPDSTEESSAEDRKALEHLKENIKRLQKEYGGFYLFHRRRTYHSPDQKYMGRERKRGALCELNDLITDGSNGSFCEIVGDRTTLSEIKYVIALDADTRLTLGSAKRLVSAMLHPLNRPILNHTGTKVEEGYGLLQPRVAVDIKSASHSLFAGIFAGQGGIEPYSNTVSDVYQDLFGEGSYTGKGIYDVATFRRVLKNAFPDNIILSHDLLEGNYIRCGLVSDVVFIDGFPWRYQAYAKRAHRWLRGDWQITGWLFSKVKNRHRQQVKNPLGILDKWKIFDNLRRSLVKPALLLCIYTALCLPQKIGFWLVGIVLAAMLSNLLLATVEWFAEKGYQFTSQKFHSTLVHGLQGALYQTLLQFTLLPFEAYQTLNAMLRVFWRVNFSHKNLLQWTTAEQAQRSADHSCLGYYKAMAVQFAAGAFLLLTVRPLTASALIIAVLWFAAPWIMYRISAPYRQKKYVPSKEQREFLLDLAERIWQYFAEFTNEKNHFLPPDNYQETPPNGIAPRTSPTNIGLFLVSALSAYDLKRISLEELIVRLEKAVASVRTLPKWKGQLYNWYDIQTMEPLRPLYVSAVDNGNYTAYLIALEQGLKSIESGEYQERIECLRRELKAEIAEADFTPLYDKERKLFYIGYHCEEGKPDTSYYDLLASEARQLSYIAVAYGIVPKEHWFELGRTLTESGAFRGLVSWSGTMFEYLMPLLLMKNVPNTLLDETYRFVLYCQKKYGAKRKTPWGSSESGFYSFDMELNYQYRAFGVPELGLRYGLSEDVVISPYSSVLALMVEPQQALENMQWLTELNLLGKYGFYEAADFTPERIPYGEKCGVVRSYMAHHLGMSMLAINNFLNDNIMQSRFHSNLEMKAAEELLEERIPTRVIVTRDNKTSLWPLEKIEPKDETAIRTIEEIIPYAPKIHLLSNGKMSCLLTDSGLGFSKLHEISLNRFSFDYQRPFGKFFYLKNVKTKQIWSAANAPVFSKPDEQYVIFHPHKAEYFRLENGIESSLQIVVSAEHHAELHTLTLSNQMEEEAILDITSYTEPLQIRQEADDAHRAFQNLFVRTDFDKDRNALYASRRTGSGESGVVFAALQVNSGSVSDITYETDRMRFLGRNCSVFAPKAVTEGNLSGTIGDVLDPIFSLRCRLVLPPAETAQITLIYGFALSRSAAEKLISLYHKEETKNRTTEIAKMRSKNENEFLNFSAKQQLLYWELLSRILFPVPTQPAPLPEGSAPIRNTLWKYGISGDFPIIGITAEGNHYEPVQELLNAHEFWQTKGIRIDLIIIGTTEGGYLEENQQELLKLTSPHTGEYCKKTQGVFLLSSSVLSGAETAALHQSAVLWFHDRGFDLNGQLPEPARPAKQKPAQFSPAESLSQVERPDEENLVFFNGYGGFAKDGRSYLIRLGADMHTPLPWSNVMANSSFGSVVTESGGGYAWSKNAHENRLTPWYNDYVTDVGGERIFLYEKERECVMLPLPQGNRESRGGYSVRHGFGYTEFCCRAQEMLQTTTFFVPPDVPARLCILTLQNESDRPRTLRLTHYITPIMGNGSTPAIHLEIKQSKSLFSVRNRFRDEFQDDIMVVACSEELRDFTCTREEFCPNPGDKIPIGVVYDRLSSGFASGNSACIAARFDLFLAPRECRKAVLFLGEANGQAEAEHLYETYCSVPCAEQLLKETKQFWNDLLDTLHVETPDQSVNLMLNGWLIYQAISCRIWGRSGYYQSGGAYGFRDQLQDSMGLLYVWPELTRKQILKHAAHQFEEGDVQHWWHEARTEEGPHKGIRTKMSDDLLWLPYVTAVYLEITGDASILSEKVPFIKGEPLGEAEERYFLPNRSDREEELYLHCLLAIRRALRFGAHGLPLIGSGDWNDGMNRVGNQGTGESVWLGWFLIDVLKKFIPICRSRVDRQAEEELSAALDGLCQRTDEAAWDGEWYRRAYFDDGTPLGSFCNPECKIDSLAQSWAVLSGAGTAEHVKQALHSAKTHLIDFEHGIVKLLTPPFEGKGNDPGYIGNYLPGIRENGGQYTHAGIWLTQAFARFGDAETAWKLYTMLNPINHARTQFEAETFKNEPYVLSADIYTNPQHTGRGGWSWYTGAAAWYWRCGVEDLLGLHKQGETLYLEPCIPSEWKSYTICYRHKDKKIRIEVKNPNKKNGLQKPFRISLSAENEKTYTIILDK